MIEKRTILYQQRNQILHSVESEDSVIYMQDFVVNDLIDRFVESPAFVESWDFVGLSRMLKEQFGAAVDFASWQREHVHPSVDDLLNFIKHNIHAVYQSNFEIMAEHEVDHEYCARAYAADHRLYVAEHLTNMDSLRPGVSLRSYAQKNPIQEYQREAYDMFRDLLKNIKLTIVSSLCRMKVSKKPAADEIDPNTRRNDPCPWLRVKSLSIAMEKLTSRLG